MSRPAVWLFDLDDTLHDTSTNIFPQMHRLMNEYIMRRLELDAEAASALRYKLWTRYGATLLGMVKHHGVNATDFLRETHAFDDLPSLIRAEAGLRAALGRLAGRKVLLTNAPRSYAGQVLDEIGLANLFQRRYPIERMRIRGAWRPKPSRAMLAHVIGRERVSMRACVLVEDNLPNLRSAKALGLRTVLVTGYGKRVRGYSGRPLGVDLKVRSVLELPRAIAHLRRG
ncbi:pyrimidine 5'-nucleotidase [soil metagenome]